MKKLLVVSLFLFLTSCGPGLESRKLASDNNNNCEQNLLNSYLDQVKPILTSKNCAACHSQNQIASGTRFKFGAGFSDKQTLDSFKALIDKSDFEQSLLLTKPTNTDSHTGGELIQKNSTDYTKLAGFASTYSTTNCESSVLSCDLSKSIPQKKVRRLTQDQIRKIVLDAYGEGSEATRYNYQSLFVPSSQLGMSFDSEKMLIDSLSLKQWTKSVTAQEVSFNWMGRPEESSCRSQSGFSRECAGRLLDKYSLKLLRRPLTSQERSEALDSIENIKNAGASYAQLLAFTHKFLLFHPTFFYRTEIGISDLSLDKVVELDNYEIASFLSFTIIDQAPDAELYEKAAQNLLKDKTVLNQQITRLLSLPESKKTVKNFFMDLLKINTVTTISLNKFGKYFADRSVRVINAPPDNETDSRVTFGTSVSRLKSETELFMDRRLGDEFSYMNLFSGNNFPVTAKNIVLYGERDFNHFGSWFSDPQKIIGTYAQDPNASNAWKENIIDYQAPTSQRHGILTHPSFLSVHSNDNSTGIVKRGVFILEQLLCHEIPAAPAEIPPKDQPPAEFDPTKLTSRQKFEILHSDQSACRFCHRSIDNIGGALENYDNTGLFRDTETFTVDGSQYTLDIISSGEITDIEGAEMRYENSVSFTQELASSEKFKSCINTRLLEYITGERRNNRNTCDYKNLDSKMKQTSNPSYKSLLFEYFNRNQFLKRTSGQED